MEKATQQLMQTCKALADPARLRIVALCARGECSVNELAQVLTLSQPRVSQHLKQLCAAGLLQRFRDGQFVFYRVPLRGAGLPRRRLLGLLPDDEPQFERDFDRLRSLRSEQDSGVGQVDTDPDRQLHRALVELSVSTPLGDVVDIGCGRGSVLKLLASRARRAVGVDIDADKRRFARSELLIAGIENCSLRQGDMYDLPFDDCEFDTVILDDVLADARRPIAALTEASRLLSSGGRLILLVKVGSGDASVIGGRLAEWCVSANLRVAPSRQAANWLIAVATRFEGHVAAA